MKLYDCKDAAKILNKKPITVRKNAREHSIGRVVGGAWIFTEADVEALRKLPGPGRPKGDKSCN
jgi:hypothetical protein